MSFFLFGLALFCALVSFLAALWFYYGRQSARGALAACSETLQEIFTGLDETSAVTRILAQEPPEGELKRLKHFLEKRGQAAVLEKEALHYVIDRLPDGIVVLNVSMGVFFCNTEFCRLLGIPEGRHTGKKLFEILRNRTALDSVESFLNQSEPPFAETEFLTPDGKNLRMRMVRARGNLWADAVLVVSDVSTLKKLESMRRDFIANVSHELRTPLTSIQGFADTLLDGAGEDPAARERFLNLMKKDIDRLGRLIEDLLALSRIESQPRDFEKQNLDVAAETEEALEAFNVRVRQKKLRIKKDFESKVTVLANRDQFRQVLVNLFDNAVKYTPEEGEIAVRAEFVGGKGTRLEIADSGPGVLLENREKVFQRFFREDKARSRETGGTGLGLAIVKHIMESHGGTARCEAGSDGKGARFTLFFPQ
jgi:two-component system phosphate regulon sensor histidine kinase PhoR